MLYPSTVDVTLDRVAELRDIILHYIGGEYLSLTTPFSLTSLQDATTSNFSTSPYNLDELNKALGYVNSLRSKLPHVFA